MSDRRLRELERRFRETGALEDEAAWLGARVQAGQITPDQLELAADLKYAPARLAQNRRPVDYLDLKLWPKELHEQWGTEVLVRVSLACARQTSQLTTRDHVRDRLSRGLVAVEAWLACPCSDHLSQAQDAVIACVVESSFSFGSIIQETVAAMTVEQAAHPYGRFGFEALYLAADLLGGTDPVRRAIEQEVVPWALGDRDVVLERSRE